MGAFIMTERAAVDLAFAVQGAGGAIFLDRLALYVNDYDPSYETTTVDLIELVAAGYAMATPTYPAVPITYGVDYVQLTANTITFTFAAYVGAPKIVFGAWLQDDSPEVTFVRRFSTPYTIPNAGGVLNVPIQIRFRNQV